MERLVQNVADVPANKHYHQRGMRHLVGHHTLPTGLNQQPSHRQTINESQPSEIQQYNGKHYLHSNATRQQGSSQRGQQSLRETLNHVNLPGAGVGGQMDSVQFKDSEGWVFAKLCFVRIFFFSFFQIFHSLSLTKKNPMFSIHLINYFYWILGQYRCLGYN